MTSNVWKECITVSSFDVGASGHLEPWALMRHFQEAAARHATSLGVGFKQLIQYNIYWVLTHLQIETDRWPDMDETITIETWPRGINKLYTTRDFLVKDAKNKTIARSTSAWVMVDASRKRPVRPADKLRDISFSPAKRALGEFPESITNEYAIPKCEHSRTVAYSDLDINQHVNNTKYIEWIMDLVNPDNNRNLRKLNIHYTSEFKKHDSALLKMSEYPNTEKAFHILVEHPESEKKGIEVFFKLH